MEEGEPRDPRLGRAEGATRPSDVGRRGAPPPEWAGPASPLKHGGMVEELPLKADVGEYTGVGSALAWLALGSCAQAHTPRWMSHPCYREGDDTFLYLRFISCMTYGPEATTVIPLKDSVIEQLRL
jgi:hypothetical protein